MNTGEHNIPFPGWKPFFLHVAINPPLELSGSGQDQEFWMDGTNPDNYQVYQKGPLLFFIDAKVLPSTVREPYSAPNNPCFVPILLHYEASKICLTAHEARDVKSKILWRTDILYGLPSQHFPRADISPSWKRISPDQFALVKPIEECRLEKEEAVPGWKIIVMEFANLGNNDKGIKMRFEIGKVGLAGKTSQPLTYGMDRVYSLDIFGIIIDPSKLKFN